MGGDSIKKVRTLNGDIPIFVPTSDTTLTVEGGFADAKVVGDKFAEADGKIAQVKSDLATETSRATATENTKADKTALARTDRSLDALWKLNNGVSYEFQKDETEAYQKDVPTGARLASVEKIGGRTLVWNQVLPETSYTNSSITDTRSFTLMYIQCVNNDGDFLSVLSREVKETGLKKYIFESTVDCTMERIKHNGIVMDLDFLYNNYAFKANHTYLFAINFDGVNPTVLGGVLCNNFQLFDLTKMFGAGNEPSTVEEFEALFPSDYYPYNEGELLSMAVNEVMEQGRNLIDTAKCVANSEAQRYNIYITLNPDGSFREHTNNYGDASHRLCDYNLPIKMGEYYTFSIDKPIPYNIRLDNFVNIEPGYTYTTVLATRDMQITHIAIDAIKNESADFTVKPMLVRGKEHLNYSKYHKNSIIIPEKLVSLDGYGDGVADDVYNYIDWENKKYHKRVGKVDLSELNCVPYGTQNEWDSTGFVKVICLYNGDWILNNSDKNCCLTAINSYGIVAGGVSPSTSANVICLYIDGSIYISMEQSIVGNTAEQFIDYIKQHKCILYYELAEEQITDISDLIGDTLQEPIEVEAGGSLTFQNTHGANYRVPVPNTVEYTVKLSEVAE